MARANNATRREKSINTTIYFQSCASTYKNALCAAARQCAKFQISINARLGLIYARCAFSPQTKRGEFRLTLKIMRKSARLTGLCRAAGKCERFSSVCGRCWLCGVFVFLTVTQIVDEKIGGILQIADNNSIYAGWKVGEWQRKRETNTSATVFIYTSIVSKIMKKMSFAFIEKSKWRYHSNLSTTLKRCLLTLHYFKVWELQGNQAEQKLHREQQKVYRISRMFLNGFGRQLTAGDILCI